MARTASDEASLDRSPSHPLPGPVVFIDGECLLCNRTVGFLAARDSNGALRFANLQGSLAERVLEPEDRDVGLDGAVVFVEPDAAGGPDRMSKGARAILRIFGHLGGIWSVAALLGRIPGIHFALDPAYRFLAHRRYRWFGRADQCLMPSPELRDRFLDDGRAPTVPGGRPRDGSAS